MKNCSKKIVLLLSALCFAISCDARPNKTAHRSRRTTQMTKKAVPEELAAEEVVIDFDTGEMLLEKNADKRCIPSSMTKMMTMYLVFQALKEGVISLDQTVRVSENARNKEGSRSFFEVGTLARIEDLIRSVIVHSGNDGCTVLAETLAGDEDAFAELMNQKADEFGLQNTHFMNCTGLPEEDHFSSVHDLAVIAQRIIRDFPEYYHYFSEKSFTINGITQPNRNVLLGNSLNIDGLKTGKTNAGGCGITISAKNNGKRLIAVVNGCASEKFRSVEANRILALGFQEYVLMKITSRDRPVGSVAVEYGKRDSIDVYCKEDISIYVPKKYRNAVTVELRVDEPIKAPISMNDTLGTMVYRYGTFISPEYEVCAKEYVEKVSLLKRCLLKVVSFFTNYKRKRSANDVETPIGLTTK